MPFKASYFIKIKGVDQRVHIASTEHAHEDAWNALQEAEGKAHEIMLAIKQTEMAPNVVPGSLEICLSMMDPQLLLFPDLGPIPTQREARPDLSSDEYWLNPEAPTLRDLFGRGH